MLLSRGRSRPKMQQLTASDFVCHHKQMDVAIETRQLSNKQQSAKVGGVICKLFVACLVSIS